MSIRIPASLLLVLALAACGDDHHDERLKAAGPRPSLSALLRVADADAGEGKVRQCRACHPIMRDALDKEGPNLFGVLGQPFGQNRPQYPYTAALKQAGGRWDEATLDRWMANPQAVVAGTKMQFAGVPDPLDRADIIAYLRQQR